MNASRSFQLTLIVIGTVASLAACRTREIELSARYGSANSEHLMAKAVLASKTDSAVTGEVDLSQLVTAYSEKMVAFPEVLAYARVAGLEGGSYTLGIHDANNCDAPADAGDSGPNTRTLTPDAEGAATLAASLSKVTLAADGGEHGLIGKTVVIHRGTGPEGAPVACGVIAKVDPPKEEHHGGHEGGEHADEAHGEAAPAHEVAPAPAHDETGGH